MAVGATQRSSTDIVRRFLLGQRVSGDDGLRPPAGFVDRLACQIPATSAVLHRAFAENFVKRALSLAIGAETHHSGRFPDALWDAVSALICRLCPSFRSRSRKRSKSSRAGIPAIQTLPSSSTIRSRA